MKSHSFLKPGQKHLAVLIDPDKAKPAFLNQILTFANKKMFDFFLVGGSLTSFSTQTVVDYLKINGNLPVVLFPGDIEQVALNADAILLLSLVSGRNPEYLIGKHVLVARKLKNSQMHILPTGYILISSNQPTAVQYITQTQPIPRTKPDIAAATALAAQLLGMKAIYLEAGSNADQNVPTEIISAVRQEVDIPIFTGGGIKSPKQMLQAYNAGADVVVIGSVIEQNPLKLADFADAFRKKIKNQTNEN